VKKEKFLKKIKNEEKVEVFLKFKVGLNRVAIYLSILVSFIVFG